MSLTFNEVFLTSYCTSKHVFKNHIILADLTTITSNDAIALTTFLVRIERWRQNSLRFVTSICGIKSTSREYIVRVFVNM